MSAAKNYRRTSKRKSKQLDYCGFGLVQPLLYLHHPPKFLPRNCIWSITTKRFHHGLIRKFCDEVVLLEQTFVIDGKTKIKDVLKQYSSELGTEVTIDSFKMLILGQGIEVEEKDFAAEVAATANQ